MLSSVCSMACKKINLLENIFSVSTRITKKCLKNSQLLNKITNSDLLGKKVTTYSKLFKSLRDHLY